MPPQIIGSVKLGPPEMIPASLSVAMARQLAMMEVAGEGETSAKKMKALTKGLVTNTKWQGTFSNKYLWRKTRSRHPQIFNPVKAKNNKDWHVEWL